MVDIFVDQTLKNARWVVCPLCDEEKCVGYKNCSQIKDWIEAEQEALEKELANENC